MKVLDLFCGAGIGAIAMKELGYDILLAIDNNRHAVSTYNHNIGNHAICEDIRNLDYSLLPDVDLIIGGVPCLPFSFGGNGEGVDCDKHGDLIYHFFEVIKYKMPEYVIFENVKGIISTKHKPVFIEFCDKLKELGYNVTWKLTDSLEYGLPQKRERVFIVASLSKKYRFPTATHFIPATIRMTIGDMYEPNDPRNELDNHYGHGIRTDEEPYVDKIPTGGNWKDLTLEDQREFMGGAFDAGGGKSGFLRKVRFDKPAHTITSQMNGKFNAQIVDLKDKFKSIVTEGCRRFTVRECLRLQSVPDWFIFKDNIPIAKQYERCSGIPPLLLKQFLEVL